MPAKGADAVARLVMRLPARLSLILWFILSSYRSGAGRMAQRKAIRIKRSKQGSLRRKTKTKKGRKIPVSKLRALKKNGTPTQKKQANFALNARKWKK